MRPKRNVKPNPGGGKGRKRQSTVEEAKHQIARARKALGLETPAGISAVKAIIRNSEGMARNYSLITLLRLYKKRIRAAKRVYLLKENGLKLKERGEYGKAFKSLAMYGVATGFKAKEFPLREFKEVVDQLMKETEKEKRFNAGNKPINFELGLLSSIGDLRPKIYSFALSKAYYGSKDKKKEPIAFRSLENAIEAERIEFKQPEIRERIKKRREKEIERVFLEFLLSE